MVDTMGMLLLVVVHPAHFQDRDGALLVLSKLWGMFPRLRLIWADGGYAGALVEWVMTYLGCSLVIVKRTDDQRGFKLLPRRWVVERTFAWLNCSRRLSKDYEELPQVSEAFIYAAMVRLMVRRLARNS
jgi:putative transposase